MAAGRLIPGSVPIDGEHIEIQYGDFSTEGDAPLTPIARVRPSDGPGAFVVDFIVPEDAADARKMIAAVQEELEFYFIELPNHDPWAYAKYHCGTASNLYGSVHWVLHERTR